MDDEEDVDAVVAESSRKVLIDVLGKERNDRVLAALYLVRQDAVGSVRMASIHIWKALVSNTPRTGETSLLEKETKHSNAILVREILPTLINLSESMVPVLFAFSNDFLPSYRLVIYAER